MTNLYTREEAANLLRVSPSTLKRMIARGDIIEIRLGHKSLIPGYEIKRLTFPVGDGGPPQTSTARLGISPQGSDDVPPEEARDAELPAGLRGLPS